MRLRKIVSGQEGAVALMVAVGFFVFVAFTAMVVDIGVILVTRNQLHNVADAATLAGARQLGKLYEGLAPSAQQSYVLAAADETLIRNAVLDAAGKNSAGGTAITINAADIRIGQWHTTTRTLTVTTTNPDAVEVTARRDATANGPITTLFAKLMGINTAEVVSISQRSGGIWTGVERPTAALTGAGTVEPGDLKLPVGISKSWFTSGFCDRNIKFYPTSASTCAGWNTFNVSPASANNLRDILQGEWAGTYEAPGFAVSDTINFTNGVAASDLFPSSPSKKGLVDLYNKFKNAAGVWETTVPVYDSTACNPSGPIQIAGFASVAVTNVLGPPDKIIEGTVKCHLVEPNSRGGGGEYGTKGSIPGLVE